MLKDDNYVNTDIFLTPPNGGMCSDEDSDREKTVSANHLSGSQLSAQAQYCANCGHLVSVSMLENNSEVVDGATISGQPCTDETMNLDINPLLLLS